MCCSFLVCFMLLLLLGASCLLSVALPIPWVLAHSLDGAYTTQCKSWQNNTRWTFKTTANYCKSPTTTVNWDECCAFCWSWIDCNVINYDLTTKTCLACNHVPAIQSEHAPGVSSSIVRPWQPPRCGYLTNQDFWGRDLSAGQAVDVTECCDRCWAHENCVVFIFNPNDRVCYLKFERGRVETFPGATGAIVRPELIPA